MAEDKKEGRSAGVVSQSISWAYPQVENDVWHYSFPVVKLNVDKNIRNWKWKPKKEIQSSCNNKEPF